LTGPHEGVPGHGFMPNDAGADRAGVTSARVAVACSGGRDSTALLHATAVAAVPLGIEVVALHVHHGLSPHADAWQQLVEAHCAATGLSCVVTRLRSRPARGESVEAWARRERYDALSRMAKAQGASLVLLAHHRRDQAETLLLQALRGAGVAGLAGMPNTIVRDGITWVRPWLRWPRESIEAYVRRHRLAHVDDDSNVDPRFARNRLRTAVWPALTTAFPQAEASLADAATWAQQADEGLRELAALDLSALTSDAGLKVAPWRNLSAARRRNAMRAWLREATGGPPPASLVSRLMDELPATGSAEWPCGVGALRRYRGVLRYVAHAATTPDASPVESSLSIRRAGIYRLPGWRGALVATRVREGGVPAAWLARLDLRPRTGGEQFQAGIGRPPRSLKKQYQSADVPPSERDGPLVYSGGQLVFVPGLGIDARVIALPGQPQFALRWARSASHAD